MGANGVHHDWAGHRDAHDPAERVESRRHRADVVDHPGIAETRCPEQGFEVAGRRQVLGRMVHGRQRIVDVALVAARGAERLDVVAGAVRAEVAVFGDDLVEGGVDVAGHGGGIAAHVEVSSGLEPPEQVGAVLAHAVLDVDLVLLVAGERQVEAVEQAVGDEAVEFVGVEVVGVAVLVAEEQPVLPGRSGRGAVVEAAERGDSVPGPIMMTATSSSGRRNDLLGVMKTLTVSPGAHRSAMWVEHPRRARGRRSRTAPWPW